MSAWTIPSYAEWAVPGYTEERLLGHGISGRVVAAVNDTTGQRVAIKYLDSSLVDDPAFIWEFRAEADQLRAVDAAHMVRVFHYAEQPGQGAAVITELIDGVSLREMITRRGPLGTVAALVMLKDTLLGLAAAHSRRIAHRDVKPENVLVDTHGWCTLTDFGVAVKADKHALAAGTPAYMAPDLWNGSPHVPATDIYAATAVFGESLTGKPPFSGRPSQLRQQHQSEPVPVGQYDQQVQDLIAWGMAKNPAERPRSARAFIHEIEARAAAVYGPYWEDEGRRALAERSAAVLPLLADGGSGSATVNRMARRKVITVLAVAGVAVIALGAAGVMALTRTQDNTTLSSATTVADTAQTTVTPPVGVSPCKTATTFSYSGTVTATQAGKLTYRWAYSTGKQGPVETLNFAAPGHQTVSGGTVEAVKASSGWGEIKLLSPTAVTSAKAPYKLLCGAGDFALSAAVQPAAQTVSSCGALAPTLTASGSVTSKKAETVSYYWALANGTRSVTRPLTFTAAGTKTVTPFKFAPPALPASGNAELVVSKPSAAASGVAAYSVACTVPVTTPIPIPTTPVTPVTSVAPVAPVRSTAPAAAKSSARASAGASAAKSSPAPSRTRTSAPPSTAPPTTAPPTTTPPTTAPPTTAPPTTAPPTTAPPTTAPPTTAPPTTAPPTTAPPTTAPPTTAPPTTPPASGSEPSASASSATS